MDILQTIEQAVRELIYSFAKQRNIIIGICSADRLEALDSVDLSAPFVHYSSEERINPRLTMPDAQSIIMIGVGYRKRLCYQEDNEMRATLSINAVGEDYHIRVQLILNALDSLIAQKIAGYHSMAFVDTGPLIEREFIKKAGLGWQGKNGLIISERFGSFFNAGYLITNLHLTPNMENDKINGIGCGPCEACINACPGKAIYKNPQKNRTTYMDYQKCVAYLTQKKGSLTIQEEQLISRTKSLYGCDICQNICKYNQDKYLEDSIDNIDLIKPKINDILKISNRDFKNKFPSISWRGKKTIQRNALLISEYTGK